MLGIFSWKLNAIHKKYPKITNSTIFLCHSLSAVSTAHSFDQQSETIIHRSFFNALIAVKRRYNLQLCLASFSSPEPNKAVSINCGPVSKISQMCFQSAIINSTWRGRCDPAVAFEARSDRRAAKQNGIWHHLPSGLGHKSTKKCLVFVKKFYDGITR